MLIGLYWIIIHIRVEICKYYSDLSVKFLIDAFMIQINRRL